MRPDHKGLSRPLQGIWLLPWIEWDPLESSSSRVTWTNSHCKKLPPLWCRNQTDVGWAWVGCQAGRGEAAAGLGAWTRGGSGSRERGGSGMSSRFWPGLLEELIWTKSSGGSGSRQWLIGDACSKQRCQVYCWICGSGVEMFNCLLPQIFVPQPALPSSPLPLPGVRLQLCRAPWALPPLPNRSREQGPLPADRLPLARGVSRAGQVGNQGIQTNKLKKTSAHFGSPHAAFLLPSNHPIPSLHSFWLSLLPTRTEVLISWLLVGRGEWGMPSLFAALSATPDPPFNRFLQGIGASWAPAHKAESGGKARNKVGCKHHCEMLPASFTDGL